MKQIILLLCTALFVVSCKEKINSVQDVMNAMAPDKQKYTIDPATDNIIKGEKGIQVFIPANALKFKDGTTPSGKVKVELKEFFSVSDFISNNLSTRSDSFLLETNGMLYISATADGKELVVDNRTSYTIAFPKTDSTKSMGLFYGDTTTNGNINWQNDNINGWGEGTPIDSLLVDSTLYAYKTRVCGWVSKFGGNIDWKMNHPDTSIWSYIPKNFKLPDSLYEEFCESTYLLGLKLYIGKNGKIHDIEFESKISERIKLAVSNYMKTLPAFDMRSMKSYDPNYGYNLTLCCHQEFDQEKYAERFKQKYSQYQDKAIEKMDKGDLGIYIFQATKFGWINCDRFYYMDEREKLDFIVNAPSPDSKTFIVFDSLNSIMSGNMVNGKFVFPNVPVNSKIKVIGINFENGKPGMAVQQSVISKNPLNINNFKSFTISELEKQLNRS